MEGRESECSHFGMNIDPPSDPLRIDEAYPSSWTTRSRTACLSLSTPFRGTSLARIVLSVRTVRPARSDENVKSRDAPKPRTNHGMGWMKGRKVQLVPPIIVWRRKCNSRKGNVSTMKAPGCKHSEKERLASSMTPTMGSLCSLTVYP